MLRTVSIHAGAVLLILSSSTAPVWAQSSNDLSVQQRFDEATREFENRNWGAAADLFAQLRPLLGSSKRARAIALIREGHARLQLGQAKMALSLLESGVAGLPADARLSSDRLLAFQDIGDAYERDFQYPLATKSYLRALPLAAETNTRISVLAAIARSQMFQDPVASERVALQALDLAIGTPGDIQANLESLRGRALMNQGKHSAAHQVLDHAIKMRGGLTLRANADDLRLRSDAAIAAAMEGNYTAAQRFLAYSGGGVGLEGGLPPPIGRSEPACGTPSFRTDDLTIIEASIGRDGTVIAAVPVYASRRGALAGTIAREVLRWRWSPATIARMHPILRSVVRIEVHCSSPDIPMNLLNAQPEPVSRWLQSNGIAEYADEEIREPEQLNAARDELRVLEKRYGYESLNVLPVLDALRSSPLVDDTETRSIVLREDGIARARGAPLDVLAQFASRIVWLETKTPEARLERLINLSQSEPFQSSPIAQGYLAFAITYFERQLLRWPSVERRLTKLATSDDLPVTNIYRVAANAQLYNYFAAKRQPAMARKYLERTGITAKPCAIHQWRRRLLPNASAYPTEAQKWGFEGWTREEFNLGAQGAVQDVRTVVAYPPLVFSKAAEAYLKRGKYVPSEGSADALPCVGIQELVVFNLR